MPRKHHQLLDMSNDTAWCACGWMFTEAKWDEYGHAALINRLLDVYLEHAAGRERPAV